uniref:Secreted protein n=1 Tax=Mycena chlorophos TaxID=658473 RepID=A0ABQ0LZR2_MYCCL|nr:predicted protein [Mycena chlorophos]
MLWCRMATGLVGLVDALASISPLRGLNCRRRCLRLSSDARDSASAPLPCNEQTASSSTASLVGSPAVTFDANVASMNLRGESYTGLIPLLQRSTPAALHPDHFLRPPSLPHTRPPTHTAPLPP